MIYSIRSKLRGTILHRFRKASAEQSRLAAKTIDPDVLRIRDQFG